MPSRTTVSDGTSTRPAMRLPIASMKRPIGIRQPREGWERPVNPVLAGSQPRRKARG